MLRNPGLRKSVEQPVLDLNFATSQIGSNAAPDARIDFSRGSNAYFVDSDGLLKKSPHNLILQSEDFGTSWTANGDTTVATNQIVAPDGTITADKISSANFGSGANHVRQQVNLPSGTVNMSVFVKDGGLGTIKLRSITLDPSTVDHSSVFTFSSESWTGLNASHTNAFVESYGNGWYRIGFDVNNPATSATGGVQMRLSANTGNGFIYLWGAQISQHTTLPVDNPYIKTTSSAVYAARLDHDPATNTPRGLLVEEARTNVAPNSEEFADISGTTRSASNLLAPDGTNTADEFTITSDSAVHQFGGDSFSGGLITTGTVSTSSFFIKLINGTPNIAVRGFGRGGGGSGGSYPVFNLTNGTVIHAGTQWEGASIEDYGNGWFRIAVSVNPSSATATIIHFIASGDDDGTISYTGNGTDKVAVWGLQHEIGTFPTSYIKTTGASVTRNADVATMGPTTGGTELVTNGTYDTDTSGWSNSKSTLSVVSGRLRVTSTGGSYPMAFQTLTTVIGRRYRITADVTFGTTAGAVVQVNSETGQSFTTSGGVLTSSGSVSVDFTANITNTNIILHGNTGTSAGQYQEFDNVSVRELYPFELYNPSEGTVVCEFERHDNTAFDYIWSFGFGTDGQNEAGLVHLDATRVFHNILTGGAQQITYSPVTVEPGDRAINAFAYQTNNVNASFSRNGSFTHSFNDTSYSNPPTDKFGIGIRLSEIGVCNNHIKRLTYYPYRLNDAVCDSKVSS